VTESLISIEPVSQPETIRRGNMRASFTENLIIYHADQGSTSYNKYDLASSEVIIGGHMTNEIGSQTT